MAFFLPAKRLHRPEAGKKKSQPHIVYRSIICKIWQFSSTDSFGDFDESLTEVTWKKESRDTTEGLLSDRTRDDIIYATSKCYLCHAPNSWMVQSSPKKLLDKNFVWTQVGLV